jgi:hypothetical protein
MKLDQAKLQEWLTLYLFIAVPLALVAQALFAIGWRMVHGCWLYSAYVLGRMQLTCDRGNALPYELGLTATCVLVAGVVAVWLNRP